MPFKTILGALVELPEEEAKQAETTQEAPAPETPVATGTPNPSTSITTAAVNSAAPGMIDPQMLEMLDNAISEANQDGFDYFEFAEAMNNLPGLPEDKRFKAVFVTAKAMGVTQEKLVSSVEYYQEVIAKEQTNFQQHVEAKTATEITARQEKKTNNEQSITEAQEQIITLNQKIAELQQENIQLDTEMSQETIKINNTSRAFEATFNKVNERLENDKSKIQSYLTEGAQQ